MKLSPVLNEIGTRALQKVSTALELIAEYHPRRVRRIARDMPWIWIQRAGYAPAYFINHMRLCILDREYMVADDTSPALIAALLVHEATHARLSNWNIPYVETARTRIEAVCDNQAAEFARRLPDGEALAHRMLARRPTDSDLSNETLDRRMAEAVPIQLEATRKDIEDADLPAWLKKFLRKFVRARAA